MLSRLLEISLHQFRPLPIFKLQAPPLLPRHEHELSRHLGHNFFFAPLACAVLA